MVGFNMALDAAQNELASLEMDLERVRAEALSDGVIDEDERRDIDDIETLIAETRREILRFVEEDAPPSMLAREPEPGTMEHDAARQAAEAKWAAAESSARAARDAVAERRRRKREADEKAARAEAEAMRQAAKLLGKAQGRRLGVEDLRDLPPSALKKLYRDLKAARDEGGPFDMDLLWNVGAVKGALTVKDGPVTDKDDMRSDANRLLSIVQEHWVDDGDEAEMISIIEYYAKSPEAMEAFFGELDNHHYWGGIFDQNYVPLITALKRELEGGNGKRFVQLMNAAKSERIREYEDPEEVTFREVLWDDIKTGAAARRIYAFGKGFGGAAWETAKGIGKALEMLADDPVAFAKAMASGAINLPGNVVKFFQSMPERWKEFERMTPEQQAEAIGKITFEAEMLITDIAGAKAAAGGAAKMMDDIGELTVRMPARTPAMAVAGGPRMAAGAAEAVVDLSKLGPGAGIVAGGGVLAPELSHLSKALDDPPGGASGRGGGAKAPERGGAAAGGAGEAARSAEELFAEFAGRRDVNAVRQDMHDLGLDIDDLDVTPDELMSRIGKGSPEEMDEAARYLQQKLVEKAEAMPFDRDVVESLHSLQNRDPGGALAGRADDVAEAGLTTRGGKGGRGAGSEPKTLADEARADFDKVRGGYARDLGVEAGGQVHHAVELHVLDRYPGTFTRGELNGFDNMRGIGTELAERRQLHNSKIREFWNRHYTRLDRQIVDRGLVPGSPEYRAHVRTYLLEARDEIDYLLGQFFTEYRKGLPRSFE